MPNGSLGKKTGPLKGKESEPVRTFGGKPKPAGKERGGGSGVPEKTLQGGQLLQREEPSSKKGKRKGRLSSVGTVGDKAMEEKGKLAKTGELGRVAKFVLHG